MGVSLNDLEKIANQVAAEHDMNPDPLAPVDPEEVQQVQNAGDPGVEPISQEEAALQHQLDEEVIQNQMAEEGNRQAEHDAIDRALLEGAAGEAISEMEDEEIKDLLIDKAANEMFALGSLASLVDISTEDDYEDHYKEAATQTLQYMAQSHDHFIDGLNKTASEIYSHEENVERLFTHGGVKYVFEQLAKLNDYNSLSKVANDDDLDALHNIVENEVSSIAEAQEIVSEAYDEAIKEIAKEDIKQGILNSGEYDDAVENGGLGDTMEVEASNGLLSAYGINKQANPVGAVGRGVKKAWGGAKEMAKNTKNLKSNKHTKKNLKGDSRYQKKRLKEVKGDNSSKGRATRDDASSKLVGNQDSIDGLNSRIRSGRIGQGVAASGVLGGTGLVAAGDQVRRSNNSKSEDTHLERKAHQFLDEVYMYKEAKKQNEFLDKVASYHSKKKTHF